MTLGDWSLSRGIQRPNRAVTSYKQRSSIFDASVFESFFSLNRIFGAFYLPNIADKKGIAGLSFFPCPPQLTVRVNNRI